MTPPTFPRDDSTNIHNSPSPGAESVSTRGIVSALVDPRPLPPIASKPRTRPILVCERCPNTFVFKDGNANRFCSRACFDIARVRASVPFRGRPWRPIAGHVDTRCAQLRRSVAVRFDGAMFAEIAELAKARNVSFAAVVRDLVRRGLDR